MRLSRDGGFYRTAGGVGLDVAHDLFHRDTPPRRVSIDGTPGPNYLDASPRSIDVCAAGDVSDIDTPSGCLT